MCAHSIGVLRLRLRYCVVESSDILWLHCTSLFSSVKVTNCVVGGVAEGAAITVIPANVTIQNCRVGIPNTASAGTTLLGNRGVGINVTATATGATITDSSVANRCVLVAAMYHLHFDISVVNVSES